MRNTIDRKGLSAFVAIISNASFEKAAEALFITQSAVSQRLKLLEESLGQTLIIRSPQIKVTNTGEALLKYAQQLEQIEHSFFQEIAPNKQQDWLNISIATNADTLSMWLLNALAPWCKQHKVLLDLKIDDQDETHQLLHTGQVVGCITSIKKAHHGTTVTEIGSIQYHCVVSPQFYKKYFANGVTKKQLEKAPIVAFNHQDQLQTLYLKEHFNIINHQPLQHYIPALDSHIEWIKAGMGFGMAPIVQVQPFLDSGELLLLTPEKFINIPLYWHQWGITTDLSRSLTKQITGHFNVFQ